MDRKDLEKPLKYAGNTAKWYGWAESFRRYLRRHDLLRPDLLTKIEKMEGRVITKEDEDALRKEYYWKDVPLLKYKLYSALEAFTDGEARKEVRFNGG